MRPKLTTLVLAAGQSRRMGAQNKLLLPVGGIPMIRHMVWRYSAVTDGDLLVATGHDAGAVTNALQGTAAKIVFNPGYTQGQQYSVARGLRTLAPADVLMIALGDMPLLSVSDLRALIVAHGVADSTKISIPVREGQRGNPILVPADLWPRLLEGPNGPGCRGFTRKHPDHVQHLTFSANGFFTDVDTPEAFAALNINHTEVLT